jgi:hypothetical protein
VLPAVGIGAAFTEKFQALYAARLQLSPPGVGTLLACHLQQTLGSLFGSGGSLSQKLVAASLPMMYRWAARFKRWGGAAPCGQHGRCLPQAMCWHWGGRPRPHAFIWQLPLNALFPL